jgi:hypothetical protein
MIFKNSDFSSKELALGKYINLCVCVLLTVHLCIIL